MPSRSLTHRSIAALLSRSVATGRRVRSEKLDDALQRKADDQPYVKQPPYNTSNTSNPSENSDTSKNSALTLPEPRRRLAAPTLWPTTPSNTSNTSNNSNNSKTPLLPTTTTTTTTTTQVPTAGPCNFEDT